MAEEKMMRLSQVARKLNVGLSTITEHLATKGFQVESKPNAKISQEQFSMLAKEFESSAMDKEEASGLTIGKKHGDNVFTSRDEEQKPQKADDEDDIFIKNMAEKRKTEDKEVKPPAPEATLKEEEKPEPKPAPTPEKEDDSNSGNKLQGIKVIGKIDLDNLNPKKSNPEKAPKSGDAASADDKGKKQEEPPVAPKEAPKASQPEAKEQKTEAPKRPEAKEEKSQEKPADQSKKEQPATAPEAPKADTSEEKSAAAPSKPEAKQEQAEEPQVEKAAPAPQEPAKEQKGEENIETKEKPKAEEIPAAGTSSGGTIEARADTLKGLTVLGKIELPDKKKKAKPVASSDDNKDKKKKKRPRKRVSQEGGGGVGRPLEANRRGAGGAAQGTGAGAGAGKGRFAKKGGGGVGRPQRVEKEELTDKEIQDKIKATLAKLSGNKKPGSSANRSKYRRDKRSAVAEANEERMMQEQEDAKTLNVTEFVSANDLASLMDVTVNEVISTCMSLGMFVSINQRLDAESITVIADEFGYNVNFGDADDNVEIVETEDSPDQLSDRAPIVTIMGHVDHGKTSLLDYIRSSKVTAGEAGGITQHIGAYDVTTEDDKRIAFLDTPGHEAFTAMRARGAKVTDVVIIVVAADDNVMPQTKEAINHAQVAGVPIVIAINKVDKPNANPDKIREELSKINILVEDWGGKYQCQEISAKTGDGINELLEKVLLEAELLELKANAAKRAIGTVIEATLDKGRGYVTTILVQSGTLRVGDVLLAGAHYGKVKAMFDHRGNKLKEAGPSTPVAMLGLDGAPQAGDRFNVMESDREAREVANKREQINREQSIRTKKHITLDEIGRRLAIGSFKELNVIVKGDVDGSVEALSDSLLKLSTAEVQVNIIHKAVGQISESDVLLASASDAIVIGFQVRPSVGAKRISEQEEIEIRLYSIIYDAIDEIKDAMEGMLAPKVEEAIVGNTEVRDVFKITKVGTVAGCYVTNGYLRRNHKIRLIRDGIVVHSGAVDQLKRFKEDTNEVRYGYECGVSIKNFNDIQIGDVIESFEEKEVKRKL